MPLSSESLAPPVRIPLTVRNNMPNPTVFTKTVQGDNLKITLGTAGQPDAEQRVPLTLAEDTDFLNALEQGVISVVGGPTEIVQYLNNISVKSREEHDRAEHQRMEAIMDRAQDRDMLGVPCIGPASRGRIGDCGRTVIQAAAKTGQVPPLCPQHEHLTAEFHLVETGSKGEEDSGASQTTAGVVRREWKRAVITAPQRGE